MTYSWKDIDRLGGNQVDAASSVSMPIQFWDSMFCLWSSSSLLKIMDYHQIPNISRTLAGNKIVDQSDVVGASPVGAAPTTSSFST